MISPGFDFVEFVASIKDLDYDEIMTKTQEEIYETGRRTAGGVKGAPAAREAGAGAYKNLLGGLLFLLSENRKPSSVNSWDLVKMRPIVETLVRKGKLNATALHVFDQGA